MLRATPPISELVEESQRHVWDGKSSSFVCFSVQTILEEKKSLFFALQIGKKDRIAENFQCPEIAKTALKINLFGEKRDSEDDSTSSRLMCIFTIHVRYNSLF